MSAPRSPGKMNDAHVRVQELVGPRLRKVNVTSLNKELSQRAKKNLRLGCVHAASKDK